MARKRETTFLRFPTQGIDVTCPRTAQPEGTCIDAQNVQVYDPLEGRVRGGQRSGLTKYLSAAIQGTARIQFLGQATFVSNSAPGTTGIGFRTIRACAVSAGSVEYFTTSSSTAATGSGSRSISSTAPFVMGTELFGRLYLTDGISYRIWVASNNTVTDWTPTAGSLPGTDGTIVARLIETWGARIVLAGLPSDSHNYFMSKIGDPLDFDYAPAARTVAQAAAGDVGVLGKIGDVITSIVPYNDDILIMGCDHSLWALSGNPMEGAGFDLISDTIGMPFGKPWCMDSIGHVFFMSSKGTVYRLDGPQTAPVPISDRSISPELDAINLNTNMIRMQWDEVKQGFYMFVTPFTEGAATHWWFDVRAQAWFKVVFATNTHNPMASMVLDGDAPSDRVILLGSETGFVRYLDDAATTDDSTAIVSYVTMGPIQANEKPFIIAEIQCHSDSNSNTLLYETGVGDTAEAAALDFAGTFVGDGTFAAGRSVTHNPRQRATWAYVKVGHTAAGLRWAFENVRVAYSVVASSSGRRHTQI